MKARTIFLAVLLLATVVFTAGPLMADVYSVTLEDGKVFLTRYQPREASFDSSLVTFLDDHGNLIAIPRDKIASVTSETESKGYGLRINTTTLLMGYTANNGVVENQVFVNGAGTQSFDIEQFVEPSRAGGGFPVFGVHNNGSFFGQGLAASPNSGRQAPVGQTPAESPVTPPVQ